MIKEDFHCDCCIHNDDYDDVTPDGMQQLESQAIYQTLLNKHLIIHLVGNIMLTQENCLKIKVKRLGKIML